MTDEPDDDMSDALEAVAWLPAATDEDLLAELARRGLDNPDSISDYAEQRARVERQRTLADPDRRLCPDCGGHHTQYEYDDTHRNDEGGYRPPAH